MFGSLFFRINFSPTPRSMINRKALRLVKRIVGAKNVSGVLLPRSSQATNPEQRTLATDKTSSFCTGNISQRLLGLRPMYNKCNDITNVVMRNCATFRRQFYTGNSTPFRRFSSSTDSKGGDDTIPEFTIDVSKIHFNPTNYESAIFPEDGKITLDFVEKLLSSQKERKKLHEKFAYEILLRVREVFKAEPTLKRIALGKTDKITIVGDLHGQYFDLMKIFELNGLPSANNPYVFNGDFVDRGSFSVEVALGLFALKLLHPEHVNIARGNHESTVQNEYCGFKGEVEYKYEAAMFTLYEQIFNSLPLAHLVNEKNLIVHGGIPIGQDVVLDDIGNLKRNGQPPKEGLMAELLWNDPCDKDGIYPSGRGCGFVFGPDISKSFCQRNKLDRIIRSHQTMEEGYMVAHDGRVITIFSAPNYMDTEGNEGAFIKMTGDESRALEFVKFKESPHPPIPAMFYSPEFHLFR